MAGSDTLLSPNSLKPQIMQNQQTVDRSVFKKDKLDRNRLKVAKRRFNESPESKEKIVTLFKFTF